MVRRVTGPWNTAALPEIMAGALQEGKGGVAGGVQTGEQQASNQVASPERVRLNEGLGVSWRRCR